MRSSWALVISGLWGSNWLSECFEVYGIRVSEFAMPCRNSRDNMTCMILHLVDGSDWANFPDEMKNYEKLPGCSGGAERER